MADSDIEQVVYVVTFNSLSRDHGITDPRREILNLERIMNFQLPLSGSHALFLGFAIIIVVLTFNSLSRDHQPTMCIGMNLSPRRIFQLPLSGSLFKLELKRLSVVAALSTPSLGITVFLQPHHALR